ncbi:MAG: TPM domain-containing protein [Pseudomonadota bacterium]
MPRFFLSLFLCLLLPVVAIAQTYPDYTELFVNDFADLLSDEEEQNVRDKLRKLRRDAGVEFTLVTISSISDYGHSGEVEPFATGLFNTWGVGNAERDDGVMMLVVRNDRKIRIEVGSGYKRTKNRPMKRIIDDVILPEFRSDRYAKGITLGVAAAIEEVKRPPPTWGERVSSWVSAIWSSIVAFIEFLIWPMVAGIAALLTWLYRRYLRYHARFCPIDRTKMELLAEHWDDAHLKPGQLKEEELQSVDYDVWQCPKCEHRTIEAYKSWFSRYGACRSCGYRTLEGETEILEAATTSSTGRKRVSYSCLNCGDQYEVIKTIPKVSQSSYSSSGGSSSFGGGSSSGGGASGSW